MYIYTFHEATLQKKAKHVSNIYGIILNEGFSYIIELVLTYSTYNTAIL